MARKSILVGVAALGAALAMTVTAVLGGAGLSSPAGATHTPANKVVGAGSKVEKFDSNQQPVVLLEATLRTSKPTDLILQLAMECSIITDVQTGPSDVAGASDTATAEGKVLAWVEIDGKIVPINSTGDGTPGTDSDKVTFCNRVHQQDAEDGEDPQDGLDKMRTYLKTKAANSFNWLRLNMGSGVHTIVVKGDLTATTMGSALNAEAMVGNRSLIVEPAKLANDAQI